MSLIGTEDGLFASEDIRFKETSGSSVSSGSSYQRYVDTDSVEVETDSQDGISTAEETSSDQEDKQSVGSVERRLSHISISSGLTDSRVSVVSDHSIRRSIGRGSLMDRLKRESASVRPGSTASAN